MTIPRYLAISKYQHNNPPLHLMVAAYMGAGRNSGSEKSGTDENGQSLFDLFPMTNGGT